MLETGRPDGRPARGGQHARRGTKALTDTQVLPAPERGALGAEAVPAPPAPPTPPTPPTRSGPGPAFVLLLLGVAAAVGLAGGALARTSSGETASEASEDQASVPWQGDVEPAQGIAAEASCEADGSRDAGGAEVSYGPELAVDGDLQTAWRCPGDGEGERMVLELGATVPVAELGLVPGYAKTDPVDGTDRYAENRRLTAVRWSFDDGSSVDQDLDPDPARRDLQTIRVPPVETSRVVLQILGSDEGSRDLVAVSEVLVAAAS